eukprot:gnl/Dysnectes_brevis/1401_a1579_1354.p1 GENE.gnl/Dysnectes_brevis/1401_a1579_1354~~gnl/Dysnectes_brevis/1401_a1579_1354.p1  ORF type:complete len:506 (+),score=131.60 gnl/Dysnectes_brevis/1401_a1579_1354:459-1976(+)
MKLFCTCSFSHGMHSYTSHHWCGTVSTTAPTLHLQLVTSPSHMQTTAVSSSASSATPVTRHAPAARTPKLHAPTDAARYQPRQFFCDCPFGACQEIQLTQSLSTTSAQDSRSALLRFLLHPPTPGRSKKAKSRSVAASQAVSDIDTSSVNSGGVGGSGAGTPKAQPAALSIPSQPDTPSMRPPLHGTPRSRAPGSVVSHMPQSAKRLAASGLGHASAGAGPSQIMDRAQLEARAQHEARTQLLLTQLAAQENALRVLSVDCADPDIVLGSIHEGLVFPQGLVLLATYCLLCMGKLGPLIPLLDRTDYLARKTDAFHRQRMGASPYALPGMGRSQGSLMLSTPRAGEPHSPRAVTAQGPTRGGAAGVVQPTRPFMTLLSRLAGVHVWPALLRVVKDTAKEGSFEAVDEAFVILMNALSSQFLLNAFGHYDKAKALEAAAGSLSERLASILTEMHQREASGALGHLNRLRSVARRALQSCSDKKELRASVEVAYEAITKLGSFQDQD